MRCIFCKADSSGSISEEHIIPQSMGNIDHVLPRGAVCDKCNQYFSSKVEQPLLESGLFRHIRAQMEIPSKRGRVPTWDTSDGVEKPSYRLMGRFLGKVGLEAFVLKVLAVDGWNDEVVQQNGFDDLRRFARFNEGTDWPFATRTLHPVNAIFTDRGKEEHLLHEFDILLTERSEVYSVVSLFGVELVINLGGRTLDGFRDWSTANNFTSPLYAGKNA
ncbi:MAG TPA: HNH endonuclease [Candidatus Paceibacterota bacterium]